MPDTSVSLGCLSLPCQFKNNVDVTKTDSDGAFLPHRECDGDNRPDDVHRDGNVRAAARKRHSLLSFPYICPEPVLAKRCISFSNKTGPKERALSLRTCWKASTPSSRRNHRTSTQCRSPSACARLDAACSSGAARTPQAAGTPTLHAVTYYVTSRCVTSRRQCTARDTASCGSRGLRTVY